jgi:hypothetical protein
MKRLSLKGASKGIIQITKKVREEPGIRNEVSAKIEDRVMRIEPVESVLDRLKKQVTFNFKSVEEDLPKLRKATERELIKHAS